MISAEAAKVLSPGKKIVIKFNTESVSLCSKKDNGCQPVFLDEHNSRCKTLPSITSSTSDIHVPTILGSFERPKRMSGNKKIGNRVKSKIAKKKKILDSRPQGGISTLGDVSRISDLGLVGQHTRCVESKISTKQVSHNNVPSGFATPLTVETPKILTTKVVNESLKISMPLYPNEILPVSNPSIEIDYKNRIKNSVRRSIASQTQDTKIEDSPSNRGNYLDNEFETLDCPKWVAEPTKQGMAREVKSDKIPPIGFKIYRAEKDGIKKILFLRPPMDEEYYDPFEKHDMDDDINNIYVDGVDLDNEGLKDNDMQEIVNTSILLEDINPERNELNTMNNTYPLSTEVQMINLSPLAKPLFQRSKNSNLTGTSREYQRVYSICQSNLKSEDVSPIALDVNWNSTVSNCEPLYPPQRQPSPLFLSQIDGSHTLVEKYPSPKNCGNLTSVLHEQQKFIDSNGNDDIDGNDDGDRDDDGDGNRDDDGDRDDMELCVHSNITTSGGAEVCQDCGMEITTTVSHDQEWRWYCEDGGQDPTRVSKEKVDERSISSDLQELELPRMYWPEINSMYFLVTNKDIKRRDPRRALIYACFYLVCKYNGVIDLAEKFKPKFELEDRTMFTALRKVNLKLKKALPHISVTPTVSIARLLKKYNSNSKNIQKAIHIYEKVAYSSQLINSSNNWSVSSAIVYYYLRKSGKKYPLDKFLKDAELSRNTLVNLFNDVCDVLDDTDTKILI